MKSISVIIPNWNGADLLEECLTAVRDARDACGAPVEIILSDNASTDGSVALVREKFPEVTVLVNDRNMGFSINANRAASAASNDILYLINSDVIIRPDSLPPLVEHFDDPEVFAVTSRSLNIDGSVREARKTRLFKKIWGVNGLRHDLHNTDTDAPRLHLMATGGHTAFDRPKFESLGGFDPLFSPFYWEDSDLSHRAWKRGWKLIYDPRSTVVHKHASVIHSRHRAREVTTISHRNRLLFIWKNINSWNILLPHFLGLAFKSLICLPTFDTLFIQSTAQALARLGETLSKRSAERRQWKFSDTDVLRLSSCDADPRIPLREILANLKGGTS